LVPPLRSLIFFCPSSRVVPHFSKAQAHEGALLCLLPFHSLPQSPPANPHSEHACIPAKTHPPLGLGAPMHRKNRCEFLPSSALGEESPTSFPSSLVGACICISSPCASPQNSRHSISPPHKCTSVIGVSMFPSGETYWKLLVPRNRIGDRPPTPPRRYEGCSVARDKKIP